MFIHLTFMEALEIYSPDIPHIRKRQRVTDSTSQTDSHSRSATSSQHGNLPIPRGIDIVGRLGKGIETSGFPPQESTWYDHRLFATV